MAVRHFRTSINPKKTYRNFRELMLSSKPTCAGQKLVGRKYPKILPEKSRRTPTTENCGYLAIAGIKV